MAQARAKQTGEIDRVHGALNGAEFNLAQALLLRCLIQSDRTFEPGGISLINRAFVAVALAVSCLAPSPAVANPKPTAASTTFNRVLQQVLPSVQTLFYLKQLTR